MNIDDKARSIPSLDGMRAVSILLVIVAHSRLYLSHWITIPEPSYLLFAHTGVSVFFVISGFLITSLLLKELRATAKISLKRFYVRRAFRIFPAFYLYLGIIFALTLGGILRVPLHAFFIAAIYMANYFLEPGLDFAGLQHLWSLSVEEQFYLLWPAALLLLRKRNAIYLAVFLILVSPLSRAVTYLALAPQNRAIVSRMFHSSVDTIMFGCLLALLWQDDRFAGSRRICTSNWSMGAAVFFLCYLDPLLDLRFHGRYGLTIGMTLEGVSICVIMIYVVRRPASFPGKVLNSAVLRHLGVISYSLYLWQNILINEAGAYFPINLVAILACAELSYWVVERPCLRLRDRLLGRQTTVPGRG